MMAGVGVAHKLLKKKKPQKQEKDNNTNLWQSHSVKTIYKQSTGTGILSHVSAQP